MSSNDKQGKTELNISSHQQKDKAGDYPMSSGVDKNKEKHDKTTITFERKKCDDKTCQNKDHQHSWNKDKDLNKDKEFHYENKDLNKDKDWNKDKDFNKDLNKDKDFNKDKDMHDKSEENKGGIINTIKEKVKDVLGSGDSDKTKEKDKDVHMSSNDKIKDEKFGSSTVGVSGSQQHASNLGSSGLGASHVGSSGVGSSNLGSSGLSSDRQFATGSAVGSGYSGAGQSTIDHKNLGAEHREVGYDKQANVIPSKEKDKDTAHKVDIHGSLYTSGAGSTYKTNEAK